jgi:hypothetical protein
MEVVWPQCSLLALACVVEKMEGLACVVEPVALACVGGLACVVAKFGLHL